MVWCYADTMLPVSEDAARPCGHCGLANTPDGHDGCLGTLPGVLNACCGHGIDGDAYVCLDTGKRYAGSAAIGLMLAMGAPMPRGTQHKPKQAPSRKPVVD